LYRCAGNAASLAESDATHAKKQTVTGVRRKENPNKIDECKRIFGKNDACRES
jgi:hypothetical protein